MSEYKIRPLNGVLAKARSCREFMEAVVPWAEAILIDLGEVTPRLFFATEDGEDGLLTGVPEPTNDCEKDELAYKLRRFCALHGVKACALLSTATLREPPPCDDRGSEEPAEAQDDSPGIAGGKDESKYAPAGGQLLPVGTFVGWLCGEFLGEAARVCVWKIDSSMGPVRVQQGWNTEVTGGGGRFEYLLGQGQTLGYPVPDELRDRIVAHLQANIGRQRCPGTILSVEKGKTAGEIAMETDEGPGRTRIVEKDGFLYFIGLYTGTPGQRAKKSRLLAELGMDGTAAGDAD